MDYEDMTNEELDRLSADKLGISVTTNEENGPLFIDGDVLQFFWNPTHPNSNQAERYLFPKLREVQNIEIQTLLMGPWFCIEIKNRHGIDSRIIAGDHHDMLAMLETKDLDKGMEKLKTIACLMAWEKLDHEKH